MIKVHPPTDVRAQVFDEHGAPIDGACFLVAEGDTITTQQALASPTATTDANGRLGLTIPSARDNSHRYALITARNKTSIKVQLKGPLLGAGAFPEVSDEGGKRGKRFGPRFRPKVSA